MCNKFEMNPLKPVGGADYTISIPYISKQSPKVTKFKKHNYVKINFSFIKTHICQVLRKSQSEIVRVPLTFADNLAVERMEKSGAKVLKVRFFFSLNRHKLLTEKEIICIIV